jgi:hypothetical protein
MGSESRPILPPPPPPLNFFVRIASSLRLFGLPPQNRLRLLGYPFLSNQLLLGFTALVEDICLRCSRNRVFCSPLAPRDSGIAPRKRLELPSLNHLLGTRLFGIASSESRNRITSSESTPSNRFQFFLRRLLRIASSESPGIASSESPPRNRLRLLGYPLL